MRPRAEASIDAVFREACAECVLPGVVAMAADARGVFYEGVFGSADLSSAAPMRTDAVFRIASMTKALTAVAAMQLVERGVAFARSARRNGAAVSGGDRTMADYEMAWPAAGCWREIFNSDAYDDCPPTGNAGAIEAWWAAREGFSATARLTLPANAILVFAR